MRIVFCIELADILRERLWIQPCKITVGTVHKRPCTGRSKEAVSEISIKKYTFIVTQ
jgi:hypothetical protein